jgi:hypothetical protein
MKKADLLKIIREEVVSVLTRPAIREEIDAAEARNTEDSIQTVIDKKRDIGWLTIKGATIPEQQIWSMIKDNGLKTLKVNGSPFQPYIIYNPGAEKKAKELKAIAEKYGGYLAYNATEQDTRRIGELLGYKKADIDAFIRKNYKTT